MHLLFIETFYVLAKKFQLFSAHAISCFILSSFDFPCLSIYRVQMILAMLYSVYILACA